MQKPLNGLNLKGPLDVGGRLISNWLTVYLSPPPLFENHFSNRGGGGGGGVLLSTRVDQRGGVSGLRVRGAGEVTGLFIETSLISPSDI